MWKKEWNPKWAEVHKGAGLPQEEFTLLAKYHDLASIFEVKEADELPPHWEMDRFIELIPSQKFLKGKLYSWNPVEMQELWKFIDQNLRT